MWLRKCLVVAGMPAVLFCGWSPARAAEKTEVGVTFQLAEGSYLNHFNGPGVIPKLEAETARSIAAVLQEHLGFLSFTPDPNRAHNLDFRLDRQDPSATGPTVEVGFHVTLKAPDKVLDPIYIQFRSADRSRVPIGIEDEFLSEVTRKIGEAAHGQIFEALLSNVPIADTATFWKEPLMGWVIPYRADDICMDRESVLAVSNQIALSPTLKVPRQFQAKALMPFDPIGFNGPASLRDLIFAEIVGGQSNVDQLRDHSEKVQVEKVFVIQYHHLDATCRRSAVPPSAAGLALPGGAP